MYVASSVKISGHSVQSPDAPARAPASRYDSNAFSSSSRLQRLIDAALYSWSGGGHKATPEMHACARATGAAHLPQLMRHRPSTKRFGSYFLSRRLHVAQLHHEAELIPVVVFFDDASL